MKFLAILILSSLACLSHADELGGGGVIRDGQVMTFFSAGLITGNQEESLADIPQLSQLMQTLYRCPYFLKEKMVTFISSIRPSPDRKYYRVLEKYFDAQTEKRIRAEYIRTMKVPNENIVLFAVTDSNSKITYLFPNFYRLKPAEQMAILFHEGYWVNHPNSSYETVIAAEAKAQAYFEHQESPKAIMSFVDAVGGMYDYFKAAAQVDLRSGALKEVLDKNGNLPFLQLFGEETLNCIRTDHTYYDCRVIFKAHLIELGLTYPNSFLFAALLNSLDKNEKNLALLGKSMFDNNWTQTNWVSLLVYSKARADRYQEYASYRPPPKSCKKRRQARDPGDPNGADSDSYFSPFGNGGFYDNCSSYPKQTADPIHKNELKNATLTLQMDEDKGAFVSTSTSSQFYLMLYTHSNQ